MLTDGQLKALILHKLFMKRCWGGKHTDFENLKGVSISESWARRALGGLINWPKSLFAKDSS